MFKKENDRCQLSIPIYTEDLRFVDAYESFWHTLLDLNLSRHDEDRNVFLFVKKHVKRRRLTYDRRMIEKDIVGFARKR